MENHKNFEGTHQDLEYSPDEIGDGTKENIEETGIAQENTVQEDIIEVHTIENKSIEDTAEENIAEKDQETQTSASLQFISPSGEEALGVFYDNDEHEVKTANGQDLSALKRKMKEEINMMLDYALHAGKKMPGEIAELIQTGHTTQLMKVHGMICDTLAPATPETIMHTRKFYSKRKGFVLFSPIPLVRNFTMISIAAIISLVASSLSSEVNTETLSRGILNNHGISLLMNMLFLCSASLMGASFFLLSKLTKEVKEASLSADDATYYWTMLIMGILSGMILSEGVSVQADAVNASVETNRLVFAILGGFSSEVVYKILQNIMQKIQSAISAI